jgi:hypothetical protein
MAATRLISETKALLLYGPYPDRNDPSKRTFQFKDAQGCTVHVPTFNGDLAPLAATLEAHFASRLP